MKLPLQHRPIHRFIFDRGFVFVLIVFLLFVKTRGFFRK